MESVRVDVEGFVASGDPFVPDPDLFFVNEAVLTGSECETGDSNAAGHVVARLDEVAEFTEKTKCEGFDKVRFRSNGVLISFVAGERRGDCLSVDKKMFTCF